jgi:outer membrane protein OmpA-like peptidoglycan-associated protein
MSRGEPVSSRGSGLDLNDVRIHTDARAAESARAVNARAYTVGRNVVFGQGEYEPQSAAGKRLLAHELAHVVQQGAAASGPQVQREVFERNFEGGIRVDEEQTGLHRIWNFDVGSAVLKPKDLEKIKTLAKKINESLDPNDATEQVDLEGQASSTGTATSNESLALKRAEAVKSALVKEGVAESKIRLIGVGEAKSEVGTTQENFARSRAVRVLFFPRAKLARPATPPVQTGCQPGVNGQDLKLSIDGGPVTLLLQGPFITLRAGTPTSPGVTILASQAMTPENCGQLSFVQNVLTFRQVIFKDGSRNTFQSKDFVLDSGDPYPCSPFLDFFAAVDGPGFGLNVKQGRISTMEVREDFRTFLMFQPNGGTRRTHQVAEWRWAGQARNNDPEQDKGTLVLDTTVSRMTPQASSGFFTSTAPALSPNVVDIPFVNDTRANPSKDSDGARLVEAMNASRPKPRVGRPCVKRPKRKPPAAPAPSTRERIGESG